MYLAATGSCITSFLWSFVRSGYGKFTVPFLIMLFVIRLISSLVFSGFICKLIGDGLSKTGLLKGYELGRSHE
jgi:energy-coupling factor transport system substrate-specific component